MRRDAIENTGLDRLVARRPPAREAPLDSRRDRVWARLPVRTSTCDQLLLDYGLILLFGLIAMESAGVPLPGETALIAAAVLAERGDLDHSLVDRDRGRRGGRDRRRQRRLLARPEGRPRAPRARRRSSATTSSAFCRPQRSSSSVTARRPSSSAASSRSSASPRRGSPGSATCPGGASCSGTRPAESSWAIVDRPRRVLVRPCGGGRDQRSTGCIGAIAIVVAARDRVHRFQVLATASAQGLVGRDRGPARSWRQRLRRGIAGAI